ncbi:MAG: hypothetical protein WBZ40_01890 [Acidimicrobiia bacterium]
MSGPRQTLDGAVLIVGSLIWDNDRRREWRTAHLDSERARPVRAPIRYGRISESRNNTYTMTLDADGATGVGALVPLARQIEDVQDLVREAEALWAAEDRNTGANALGSSWGCVGVLIRSRDSLGHLAREWAANFTNRAEPFPPVTRNGLLQIPWPADVETSEPVEFDVILATANKPVEGFVDSAVIAAAWCERGHESYFFNNVLNGIRTDQDASIWAEMKRRRGSSFGGGMYEDAIKVLESD